MGFIWLFLPDDEGPMLFLATCHGEILPFVFIIVYFKFYDIAPKFKSRNLNQNALLLRDGILEKKLDEKDEPQNWN